MTRGVFSGLVGFTLAGVVLAAVLGRVLPDDWSTSAFASRGSPRRSSRARRAALAGRWQGPPGAAILGPLVGAALLIALQPQLDLVTALSVLAVLAGAALGVFAFSSRSSVRHLRG